MPYLIIAKAPRATARSANGRELERHERSGTTDVSRRAVATLKEARDYAAAELGTTREQEATITESGGTVGPLPDGTVIEVARVSMPWIIGVAEDRGAEIGEDASDAECIAAFNARERS